MASAAELDFREAVVFLAGAAVAVPVMLRMRVSPVLGFLLVGMVISPHGLGRFVEQVPWLQWIVISETSVAFAAEMGVVFLLFMIGLELSFRKLWRMRGLVFGLGGAQILITGWLIGFIALQFGNSIEAAIVLGACLALSSTAIVMQLLTEKGRLGTRVGQASFAILLAQDIAVVPILVLVGVLAGTDASLVEGLSVAALKATVVIGLLAIGGQFVLAPVLRQVAASRSPELFLAAVLLTVVGIGSATQAAGLSLALGAFLAGLLIAETEFRHKVAVDLEPFKGLLLGAFFVSVGLGLDLVQALANPVWVTLSVIGLVLLKAGVTFVLALLARQPMAIAAETALLLSQGGEFAFVVIGLALNLGLLPAETAQFMLIVVGLSMVATPGLAALGRRIGIFLRARASRTDAETAGPPPASGLADHVVIVGFGRVGEAVSDALNAQSIPFLAIDQRPELVAMHRKAGRAVYLGDASQPEMLTHLGLDRAAGLVVTMNTHEAATRVVAAARAAWPSLPIFARVRDENHARDLIALGADHVTPETTEASLQLSQAVLIGVGLPEDVAEAVTRSRRDAASLRIRGEPAATEQTQSP